jgi:DNA polymerase-3 subunit epsilon
MYSIIDIETTGGRPDTDKITEIAIINHNGKEVTNIFCSLVNPECSIPYNITRLTGIDNAMVREAPKFYEIANQVYSLLQNNIFIAHNVRFDYSFVKAAFKNLGFNYNSKTLCTVRLSRKSFPGYSSYSLGNICNSLGIKIKNRHRALGDAEATTILFEKILNQNAELVKSDWLQQEQKITSIPSMLEKSIYENLPESTGVYYFHNTNGEVIYTGKALDIKKRISQHFSLANKGTRLGIKLKSEIADISYTNTGSELIALLLESDEIKRLKPKYNVSQKRSRVAPFYGIFESVDKEGYINLTVNRLKSGDEPLVAFDSSEKAKAFLYRQLEKFKLCLSKCDLHNTGGFCFNWHIKKCNGACGKVETSHDYNERATKAIDSFSFKNESFFVISDGRNESEKSVVCVENGQYKGFGYVDISFGQPSIEDLKSCIKKYEHNRDIQNILCLMLKKKYLKIKYDTSLVFE